MSLWEQMAVKSTSQQYRVSQVVLVPIWYLPGKTKENQEKFVIAAKIYMGASKIPCRELKPVPWYMVSVSSIGHCSVVQ